METSIEKLQSALRKAEALLAEAFSSALPQHTFLCRQMLSEPGDTTPFLRKLGHYLLAQDAELGESPVFAVVAGRSDALLQQIAKRTNIDPSEVKFTVFPLDTSQGEEKQRAPSPVFLAYCHYFATGEGVTVFVGAGNTPGAARDAFLRHAPEYFHLGLTEDQLEESSPPETRRVATLISPSILDLLNAHPEGAPQFYAALHYNLS